MKFRSAIVALLLIVGIAAEAQTDRAYRYQGMAVDQAGNFISYPKVRVCSQPSIGATCTPLATIYTNRSKSIELPNPMVGDRYGNYFFYADAGEYTIQPLNTAGEVMYSMPDVLIGSSGGGVVDPTGLALVSGTPVTGNCTKWIDATHVGDAGAVCGSPSGPPVGATWGSVTGTLSSQSDLIAALGAKFNASSFTVSNVAALFGGSGSCYLKKDGGCDTGAGGGSESTPALSEDVSNVTSSKRFVAPSVSIGAGSPTVINVTGQLVSALPTVGNTTGDQRQVSDGASASDCTVGSGSNVHWCYWTGSAWMSDVPSSSMVYPSAGIPNSTGSAWGTSYTVGNAANNIPKLDNSGLLVTSTIPDLSSTYTTVATLNSRLASGVNVASGTSATLVGPSEIYVCTGTCTLTVPVPAAGYQFCAMNAPGVSTAITLNALGSSAYYGKPDMSAYGTAGTGTLVATAASGNKVCILGIDTTHYVTTAYNGTWTAN